MQPQSLKITFKLKPEKSVESPMITVDSPSNNVEGRDQVDLSSTTQAFESNHAIEDDQNENSDHQLVLYDPNNANRSIETKPVLGGSTGHPSVGAFTVQCANCFKWRRIPTKEKYEEIREHITEKPFFCETGKEWRPDISCDDPADMIQDGSRVWAIDKPNIAQPPKGWERLLRLRAEGGSKFADVYYVAPSGKKLRSMVEIQRYLSENPEYLEDDVSLSRFSFQTPKPMRENYVRKRPTHAAPGNDVADYGMPQSFLPSEVQPLAWVRPDVDTDSQLSGPGYSTPEVKSAKKKKCLSKRSCNGGLAYNKKDVSAGDSCQL